MGRDTSAWLKNQAWALTPESSLLAEPEAELPVRWGQKKIVLDWVAHRFEPGIHYTDRQINASLAEFYDDTAALRRYLVDAGMMDRAKGEYWRSGGTVRE